jgi:hypothetical protein
MKILLDVCTPVQVRNALSGHVVHTAAKMGWGELSNGDLLREAEAGTIRASDHLRQESAISAEFKRPTVSDS